MNSIASQIQDILLQCHQTLCTAESCTSGRIAAQLTTVPGASGYFQGGLVAYQDHLKVDLLGVMAQDIIEHDVVSQPVVEQMDRGACHLFHTDYAIATTGYAGEGNGRVPAGHIWIGWGSAEYVHSLLLEAKGNRESNTCQAVDVALAGFLKYLQV